MKFCFYGQITCSKYINCYFRYVIFHLLNMINIYNNSSNYVVMPTKFYIWFDLIEVGYVHTIPL